MLDNHQSPPREVVEFAERFSNLDFINETAVLFGHGMSNFQNLGDVLPSWVIPRLQKIEDSPVLLADYYQRYAEKYGKKVMTYNGDPVHAYDSKDRGMPEVNSELNLKGYVESDQSIGNFENALESLSQQGLHPHLSKNFEDERIVLYWNSRLSKEEQDKIVAAFKKEGIPFRGLGQDSYRIVIDTEGQWGERLLASNDSALSGRNSPSEITNQRYDKRSFLKYYLSLCYRSARNPADPYKVSFYQVIDQRVSEDVPISNKMGYDNKLDRIGSQVPVISYTSNPVSPFN